MAIVYSRTFGGEKGKLRAYHYKDNPKEWVYEILLFGDSEYVSIMHIYQHHLKLIKCKRSGKDESGLYADIENVMGYPTWYTFDIRHTEERIREMVEKTINEGVVVDGDIVDSDGSIFRYYDYTTHRILYIAPEQVSYKMCMKCFAYLYDDGALKNYCQSKKESVQKFCLMQIEEALMEWILHRIEFEWEKYGSKTNI